MTVRQLKRGDWFTKKPIAYPAENQVWVRGEYDRETKKYCCHRWSDINDFCTMRGDKEVYTDFIF